MTRGKLVVALITLILASAGIGTAIAASARDQNQRRSTQVIIKETERDLIHARIQTGGYPLNLHPIPLDSWGRPILVEIPSTTGHPYRLISFGADGEPGGRGRNADINNWEF